MCERPFADERRRKQISILSTPFSVRDVKSRTWNLVPFGLVNGSTDASALPPHLVGANREIGNFSRCSGCRYRFQVLIFALSRHLFDSRHQPHIYNSIRTGTTMFISSRARNTHNTTLQRRKPPSSNRFQLWSSSCDFARSLTPAFLTIFTNIRVFPFSRSPH